MSELRRNVKVDPDVKEDLDTIAEKRGLKLYEIIRYLVTLNKDHDFFAADWKQKIIADSVEEYKRKVDLTGKVEAKKLDWKLKFKYALLMEYVKNLPQDERKTFIENMMGDLNDPAFIDHIGEMDIVILDGKRKLVRFQDGNPIFPNVEEDKIIPCEIGYHIKDQYCECKRWKECAIRRDEYIDFKFRHSSYYNGPKKTIEKKVNQK